MAVFSPVGDSITFSAGRLRSRREASSGGPGNHVGRWLFQTTAPRGATTTRWSIAAPTGLMRVPALSRAKHGGAVDESGRRTGRSGPSSSEFLPGRRAVAVHCGLRVYRLAVCRDQLEEGRLPPRGSGRRQRSLCRKRPFAHHALQHVVRPAIRSGASDGDGTGSARDRRHIQYRCGNPARPSTPITPCRRRGCSSTSNRGRRKPRR